MPENTPFDHDNHETNHKEPMEAPRRENKSTPSAIVLTFLGLFVVGVFIFWVLARPNLPQPPAPPKTSETVPSTSAPGTSAESFVLFLPDADALLTPETIVDEETPSNAPYSQKAQRALELLFPRIEFMPEGVHLLSPPEKEKDNVVRVDLSREFLKLDSLHETPVMLTLDAMTRTLGAIDSEDEKSPEPIKMQVLVEGKKLQTLSQFSLDKPWKATETVSELLESEEAL